MDAYAGEVQNMVGLTLSTIINMILTRK
jgi:alcohol oxidase